MAEDEVDFTKLPLEERCVHKSWKARLGAYEELIKLFRNIDDEKAPEWSKHVNYLRKFPSDAHAAAQEKGLEAVLIFLENSSQGPKIVAEIMSGVIAKCLTSSKARTKELSIEITMMCVEIEKFEVVQEELMKGMDVKNPKVVSASIGLVAQALREFGAKVINLKTLIKKILPLFEDRDKGVRDETKKLTVELYRWIGAGFKGQLASLKPVMLTDLESEFEKIGNQKPQPTRYLKSQQAKKEQQLTQASADAGEVEDVVEDAGPEIDPYDLLEPEDILSKLPKDFYEKCEAKKWQERKEALEALDTLTTRYQKLEPGDYGDLVRALKRFIAKDSNVVVVALAGKCIAGLANGLKKKFSPYASSCISTILEKFKEKKPNVLNSMKEASDACFAATNLEQILEDGVAALQNKNPAVKTESALFLSRSFSKSPQKTLSDKKFMKPYLTALFGNLNESDPAVRDAATEALGVVYKAAGEKALIAYTSDLDPNKMTKLKEAAEKAVILVQKSSAAPKAANAAPKPAPTKSPLGPTKKAAPVLVGRKPAGNTGTYVKKVSKQEEYAADRDQGPSTRSTPSPQLDDGDARVDISGEINEAFIEKLGDKNWKVRDEALDRIAAIIAKAKNITPNLGELPAAICQRLQDSNRNLAANAFLLCQNMAGALGPHCSKHIRSFLPSMLNGLADTKTNVRSTVVACLNAWADNCGVEEFFQNEMIADSLKGQSPLLRTELFNWLTARLPEVTKLNKEDLGACLPALLSCVEDRNVEVRKSAQDAVQPFMLHLGYEKMNQACGRLKPASKLVVQATLDKARATLPSKTQPAQTNKPGRVAGSAPIKKEKSFTKGQDSSPAPRESLESCSAGNKRARNGPVKISPTSRKPAEDAVVTYLPLTNGRAQRLNDELKLKTLRWVFPTPRDEFIDLLKDLMTNAGMHKTLIANMFHTDFRNHLKALDVLTEELQINNAMGTMASVDLILKWLTIRFFDTNPTVLMRSLDYLTVMLRTLRDVQYQMSDIEANGFVPYLLLKIGEPKDNIRNSVHSILRDMYPIYVPAKMFSLIMEGLKSKNARQRSECLDELAYLISSYTLSICPSPSASLRDISRQISDRDNSVRSSALNVLVEAYWLVGEKLYKMVGQLSDKDLSLMEERIKRASKSRPLPRVVSSSTVAPSPAVNSGSHIPGAGSVQHVYSNERQSPASNSSSAHSSPNAGLQYRGQPNVNMNETIDLGPHSPYEYMEADYVDEENPDVIRMEPETFINPRQWKCPNEYQIDFDAIDRKFGEKDLLPMPPLQLLDTNIEFLQQETPVQLPRRRAMDTGKPMTSKATTSDPIFPIRATQSIDLLISQISGQDLLQSQEAAVQLELIISDIHVSNVMLTRVDHVLVCTTMAMRKLQPYLKNADRNTLDSVNKVYRCMAQLLQSIYKGEELPRRATKETLKDLIFHLLLFIVDPNVTKLADSTILIKTVNVLVVRVIEKSDPNAVMCAIMRLLNDALQFPNNHKLMDLTMKCQWKVLKLFGFWKNDQSYPFDTEGFLNEFYFFMKTHPFSSFTAHDVTPLKTMKTIIHSVVIHLGPHNVQASLNVLPELRNSEAGLYLNKLIVRELGKPNFKTPAPENVDAFAAANALESARDSRLNPNNNLQQFFLALPDPNDSETPDERVSKYMERLKEIQKRGGIAPPSTNNN